MRSAVGAGRSVTPAAGDGKSPRPPDRAVSRRIAGGAHCTAEDHFGLCD